MDTHDLSHILADQGAHWTTVDLTDDELADLIDSLSPAEREEFGFDRPPQNPFPDAWWQTTEAEEDFLDQPAFTSSFSKVRWFALRGLADQASLTNDPAELENIRKERDHWLASTEEDQLFDTFRLTALQAANVANI
jgi:hypothetical protein